MSRFQCILRGAVASGTQLGLSITQSLAIIGSLEETYPTPSLLPGDAASRERIRSIAQLIACDVHPLNSLRVLQRLESGAGAAQALAPDASVLALHPRWQIAASRAAPDIQAGAA